MSRRILVIGGIAAGPTAASKAKRIDPKAEVTLFEQGDHISSGICEMPYYIGNVFDRVEHLTTFTPEELEKTKGVKVHVRHSVEKINTVRKSLVVRSLETSKVTEHRYDKLVLATGSIPRRLGLPGEQARNVFHVKSLEDALSIKRFLEVEKPKTAVIIGGGYIGMEMAEAFVANGIGTTILQRGALPMSGLEPETRAAVAAELIQKGVTVIPEARVEELVMAKNEAAASVKTSKGNVPSGIVIVAAGVVPNTTLAADARLRRGRRGGLLTDQRQLTSDDSIYAAGDCCEVKNLVSNKWMYIPLATTASKQGRTAGENAAGGKAFFKGAIRAIGVKVFDLQVAHVGLSAEEARMASFDVRTETIEANSRIGFFPGNAKVHIVAVTDRKSRRILGANIFGNDGAVLRANTLAVAIQHRLTIEELSQLDLIYTPPFAPLWDPILVLANHLRRKS